MPVPARFIKAFSINRAVEFRFERNSSAGFFLICIQQFDLSEEISLYMSMQAIRFGGVYPVWASQSDVEDMDTFEQKLQESGMNYRLYRDPNPWAGQDALVVTGDTDVAEFDEIRRKNQEYSASTSWEQHIENCTRWMNNRVAEAVKNSGLAEALQTLNRTLGQKVTSGQEFIQAYERDRRKVAIEKDKLDRQLDLIDADFDYATRNPDLEGDEIQSPEWVEYQREHEYRARGDRRDNRLDILLRYYRKGGLDLETGKLDYDKMSSGW